MTSLCALHIRTHLDFSCNCKLKTRKCNAIHKNFATQAKGSKLRCQALGGDPDSYRLEDDQGQSQQQASKKSVISRVSGAAQAASRSIAVAPRDAWDSVRTTAGAALDLMLLPVDQAEDVERESAAREANGSTSPASDNAVSRARERWREARSEMPKGTWGRIQWLWDQPQVKKLRITITAAQWSFRIPAILALLATQGSLIVSQLSLPLLAPLGLGFGIAIWKNASLIFPRICFLVIILYVLWFMNSLVQNTVLYLRRQGAVDARVSGAIVTASECTALVAAMVIILSLVGVNVNGLLLPAGIALAFAAKDLSHNFLAGFFLFVVQPFKLGDRISVSYSSAAAANSANRSAWFEGVCDKVDLRYTVVKSGSRKLFVPNSAFLTREFMVMEDAEGSKSPSKRDLFPAVEAVGAMEPQTLNPMGPSLPPLDYSAVSQEEAAWIQSPFRSWQRQGFLSQMEPQMPDMQPGVAQQPPDWPPSQPPAGPQQVPQWRPSRQWRGNGWSYQATPQEAQGTSQRQAGQPDFYNEIAETQYQQPTNQARSQDLSQAQPRDPNPADVTMQTSHPHDSKVRSAQPAASSGRDLEADSATKADEDEDLTVEETAEEEDRKHSANIVPSRDRFEKAKRQKSVPNSGHAQARHE